jgi:hypothetical protein
MSYNKLEFFGPLLYCVDILEGNGISLVVSTFFLFEIWLLCNGFFQKKNFVGLVEDFTQKNHRLDDAKLSYWSIVEYEVQDELIKGW